VNVHEVGKKKNRAERKVRTGKMLVKLEERDKCAGKKPRWVCEKVKQTGKTRQSDILFQGSKEGTGLTPNFQGEAHRDSFTRTYKNKGLDGQRKRAEWGGSSYRQ